MRRFSVVPVGFVALIGVAALALAGGVALGLAALYALTPLKRISQDRCRELCALHGPLPFDLVRRARLAVRAKLPRLLPAPG